MQPWSAQLLSAPVSLRARHSNLTKPYVSQFFRSEDDVPATNPDSQAQLVHRDVRPHQVLHRGSVQRRAPLLAGRDTLALGAGPVAPPAVAAWAVAARWCAQRIMTSARSAKRDPVCAEVSSKFHIEV